MLWIALLYGVYRVSQFEKDFIEYDPFSVLEIDKVTCIVSLNTFLKVSCISCM